MRAVASAPTTLCSKSTVSRETLVLRASQKAFTAWISDRMLLSERSNCTKLSLFPRFREIAVSPLAMILFPLSLSCLILVQRTISSPTTTPPAGPMWQYAMDKKESSEFPLRPSARCVAPSSPIALWSMTKLRRGMFSRNERDSDWHPNADIFTSNNSRCTNPGQLCDSFFPLSRQFSHIEATPSSPTSVLQKNKDRIEM
mmetsp:Transcript_11002/g.37361  ORF Transcript_11002/g.37361 Transcript_11002/m.37361 type:complete len:200 (-) Transcript_11002:648-1247(-)